MEEKLDKILDENLSLYSIEIRRYLDTYRVVTWKQSGPHILVDDDSSYRDTLEECLDYILINNRAHNERKNKTNAK